MGYDVYTAGVVQGTRQRNWNFHLAKLEGLCIWFFAYSRLESVQKIPSHIAQMYSFKATNPQVWNEMEQGGLVIKKLSFAEILLEYSKSKKLRRCWTWRKKAKFTNTSSQTVQVPVKKDMYTS